MSTHKSYFSKNNTVLHESTVNTAKNPVTEIFYGGGFYEKDCVATGNDADTCISKTGEILYSTTNIQELSDWLVGEEMKYLVVTENKEELERKNKL